MLQPLPRRGRGRFGLALEALALLALFGLYKVGRLLARDAGR